MAVETSIILRTRNEEKWLGITLNRLFSQTYKSFEVVIVDSGSADKTLEIAHQFPVKILNIPYEKFSYPYALNYGIERASAQRYIVIISGHSVPVSGDWLERGIENFKLHQNLMGVYGPLRPMSGASFWDNFFIYGGAILDEFFHGYKRRLIIKRAGQGVLGFTNAIIRKDLWDKHNFNEDYGFGGEDGEWARYWFERGYIVIKDRKFMVRHSHGLGLIGWYKQQKYWISLWKPQKFKYLDYRKDSVHYPR